MAPNELIGYFDPLLIDKSWYDFHKEMYFIKLLDCIKNKNNLSDGWHKNICDAAILAGKSQSTNDIAQAFLLNMIAIETLLTGTNDSYSKALPKRVEAFIGWTTSWQSESYQKKISECYSKRCKYVHAGEAEQISVRDLLFSDIIISNVFYNIILNIKIFNCKQDIIEFSEKIEKILGNIFINENIRYLGIFLNLFGLLIFSIAMITMKNSWRVGIDKDIKTEFIKHGIYKFSRNPAFVGFGLMFIGLFFTFNN